MASDKISQDDNRRESVSRGYPPSSTRITIRLILIGSATRHHAGALKVVTNISIMAEVTFRVSGYI